MLSVMIVFVCLFVVKLMLCRAVIEDAVRSVVRFGLDLRLIDKI